MASMATSGIEDLEARLATARSEHTTAERRVRALRETITPLGRTVEVKTPARVWGVFGLRTVEHIQTRQEQSVADPRAARRAVLELPAAELAELEARERLDSAEVAVREARRAEYLRKLPAADARVKALLTDFARNLERLAEQQTATLAVIHEENERLGPDPHTGRTHFDAPNMTFSAVLRDPLREAPADFWISYQRKAGWIE